MNRESSLQIDSGMKEEKKNAATGFEHHQIDQRNPRNLWMIFGFVEVELQDSKFEALVACFFE